MASTSLTIVLLTILGTLSTMTHSRCMYDINESDLMPLHIDKEPFLLKDLHGCKDYLEPGRLGCCSHINDVLTEENFKQIDAVFGSDGGGCDICAINLKRFWCQYACSARQHQFMWTDNQLKPYPDPQQPGATILGQEVWVRVHTDTACALFESCKRTPFVSSVSAMGSPAGFLNFQGHNALNNAHQYISVNFSNNVNESLAFTDSWHDFAYGDLQTCDYRTNEPQIHNFTFVQNCTCNTCDSACNPNEGFVYFPPDIFEGFNIKLVGGVYCLVGIMTVAVTLYRRFNKGRVY